MKKISLIFCLLMISSFIFAQESEASTNLEDELFGSEESMLLTQDETTTEALNKTAISGDLDTASLVLEKNKLRIGGSLNSGMDLNYSWADPYSKQDYGKSFTNPTSSILMTTLGANLFFDARPTENSKIYGKFLFGFPFEKTLSGGGTTYLPPILPSITETLQLPVSTKTSGVPNIKIHELYTDFSAKDIAFFRFGKHTVKWGTGLFYSPADVINIGRINPQDTGADREGAVSLRTHIIIPKTQHNIWLYLLPPTQAEKYDPKFTAGAVKGEMVFGSWEIGIGGFYKYKKAPRLITTLSGSIAGKVSVFAEGVFAWGSDYTYHKNDSTFTIDEKKDKPFFQATIGGSYSNADSNTSIAMQYFYNGFGYKDPARLASSLDKFLEGKDLNNPAVLMLPENQKAILALQNMASMGQIGQHYIAFTVSQNKLGTDKLSLNLFQQFAISELEGMTSLKLNWHIYRFVSMSTGPSFIYPLSSKANTKGNIAYSLSVNLGGGKF